MNFFSEDRTAELRELFFDTAQELLQSLNDAGLELEKRPGDAELLRQVQRTVHTLKGDAAACGYHEISKLAHELEDVLALEPVALKSEALADVLLTAADTFHALLVAYRGNLQLPSGDALRAHIRKLTGAPAAQQALSLPQPRFAWGEYDRRMIADALSSGETVYNLALYLDPACELVGPALQLIRNVLQTAGTVLALDPDENTTPENVTLVEAALATERSQEWIESKCRVPSVVSQIVIETARLELPGQRDALDLLLEAEAAAVSTAGGSAGALTPSTGHADAASPTPAGPGVASPESTLRVDAARVDAVLNLVGELIIGKSMLHQMLLEFEKRHARDPLRGRLADAVAFQSRLLDDLQRSVMKIRMVPVKQLFHRFPRVVRDLAKQSGKDVALAIAGQDTDLDKSLLDALAEPLLHLVRNAVDHGIELPAERVAAGKPPVGTVRLNARYEGHQVIFEISDDGRGIDHEQVLACAVAECILTEEEAARLSPAEALELVFHPGLSTAENVTEISGRGVGLDAVRAALGRWKGTVYLQSQLGRGTTFVLAVPLTLTSIKALLFQVNERLYAIPISSVVEIARAAETEIHRVDNHEVFQLREELLTLVRLNRLESNAARAGAKSRFIVVVSIGDRKYGLIVDRLRGEEELVIKALDHDLLASDVISGASILGDGTVVLILDLPAVLARLAKAPTLGATA